MRRLSRFALSSASLAICVVALICCFGLPLMVAAEEQDAPSAAAENTAEQREKATGGSSIDRELIESLRRDSSAAGNESPLQRAVRLMRDAQQRIEQRDTSEKTREIQNQVVEDLDKLIKQLQQAQRNPQPNPQSDPSPSPMEFDEREQQQPENSTAQKNQDGQRRRDQEKAAESTERAEQGTPTAAELARREQLEKDVWGHLPPAVRQQLLNVYSEKFLPRYEELVRRYYEALAEQNQRP